MEDLVDLDLNTGTSVLFDKNNSCYDDKDRNCRRI